MRRLFTSIIVFFCVAATYAQPITVTGVNGTSPQNFMNNNFAGEGVSLEQCRFNWSSGNINGSQVGLFTNTNPSFPFSSGILLTTGNISVAPGPNNSGSESSTTGVNTASIDADLQALISHPLNNASVLEFNFYSGNNEYSNIVSFNYVFGSEEYPEFVCSNYNDVFAFFLTGPDPSTGCINNVTKNIAIIPGSPYIPVSINALNNGSVGSSGSANNCVSLDYSQFYITNNSNAVQYDGYTTALTAQALICPCSEYKMKISIANVSDGSYDSGVFLEQGSFNIPQMLTITDSTNLDNDTIIKNCNYSNIDFHYAEPIESSLNIIVYSDEGTATQQDFNLLLFRANGSVDYVHHGDTIVFREGETLMNLRFECSENAQFSPGQIKTKRLIFKTVLCPEFRYLNGTIEERAQYDTLDFVLIDNERFELLSDSTFYCDRCTHVEAPITGGTEPLVYNWTPANLLNNPHGRESSCNITTSTTFQVKVCDRWGCLADSCDYKVLITSTPVLDGHFHISPNVICVPEDVQFTSTATPATTHRWIIYSNNMRDTIYGNNQTYTFTEPGHYSIEYKAYEAEVCAAETSLINYINAGVQPVAAFHFDPAEAEVGQTVMFTNESEGLNVHYQWSFGDGSNSTEENPSHVYNSENSENYNVILTVSDEAGCQDMYSLPVPVVDNHVLYVPNTFTPNKDGINDVFLPVVACVARYYIIIYDRSGGIVFQSDNPEIGWDGTFGNGKQCPSGIYTYYINYVRYNNVKQELIKTGTINLIR